MEYTPPQPHQSTSYCFEVADFECFIGFSPNDVNDLQLLPSLRPFLTEHGKGNDVLFSLRVDDQTKPWPKDKRERIRVFDSQGKGVSAARNNGVAHSKGEFILPLDGDDKIAPEFLELTLQEIVKDRNIRVVYTDAQYFGARNDIYRLPDFSIEQLLGMNLMCITSLFRKEDFEIAGGFNTNMKEGFEDWDFFVSMFQDGKGTAVKIPQVLFYYRRKPVSRNSAASKANIDFRRRIWENHKEMFSKVYPDPTLTSEYKRFANSREYKLGYLILHPFKGYRKFLKNRK